MSWRLKHSDPNDRPSMAPSRPRNPLNPFGLGTSQAPAHPPTKSNPDYPAHFPPNTLAYSFTPMYNHSPCPRPLPTPSNAAPAWLPC